MPDGSFIERGNKAMQRNRLISMLSQDAIKNGLTLTVDTKRGKGSHVKVSVGTTYTYIPDRDIDPVTERKIRKTLGL